MRAIRFALVFFVFLGGRTKTSAAELDLQKRVDDAVKTGARRVVIPPGRYRVTPHDRQHLVLQNLSDFEIDADGVEMVCTQTTRAVTISRCTNLTVRGLTIDYDPLPFTQGSIVGLSADKSVQEVALDDGYPDAGTARSFKYEVFDPHTRRLRCESPDVAKVEPVGPRHLRVTVAHSHANDLERVGDGIAIGSEFAPDGSMPHAVYADRCAGLQLRAVTLYASNCFGFFETGCDGSVYDGCVIDRRDKDDPFAPRPPRLRSLNADAYHSKFAIKGPHYERCVARFMGDDAVNICGNYHLVTNCHGAVLRVLAKDEIFAVGDPVEVVQYDGTRLPDATVLKIEPDGKITAPEREWLGNQHMDQGLRTRWNPDGYRVTLDRPVDLPEGSVLAGTRQTGNGFEVVDCTFGCNRSRGILIKASDGRVTGNHLDGNWGPAILVSPEWWWLESGSAGNVTIANNTITDCKSIAIQVSAAGGNGRVAPAGAHRNIAIVENTITGCPSPNVAATSTDGLEVAGNHLTPAATPVQKWMLDGLGLGGRKVEPVMTVNCKEVTK